MTELDVKLIKLDGGTQARAGTDRDTVNEYVEALRESDSTWPFPPVIVYHDGNAYWLADGFHRITAARKHGRFVCEADIRQGTQRDAILHAAGANAEHGLRRTPEDKKRAVRRLLEDAEWGKWSDREIARRCRVSPTFVGNIRKELGDTVHNGQYEERIFVHPKTGAPVTMNTANIAQTQINKAAQRRKEARGGLTKFEYTKKLVPELVEFLRTYEDKHGRNWSQMQSVAAHTNSTPWQDITREWKRRQIYYEDGILKDAIKLAFDVLSSEQMTAPDDDYNYADELQRQIEQVETVVALASPIDTRPMPVWELEQLVKAWMSSVELKTPGVTTPYQALISIKEKHVGWRPTFESIKASAPRLCNDGDLRQAINNVISRHQTRNDGNQATVNCPAISETLDKTGSALAEKVGVVKQNSILDSLKSTEWLIEEMMIQVQSGDPLFFALNRAVMAVRDAMKVATETAVSKR